MGWGEREPRLDWKGPYLEEGLLSIGQEPVSFGLAGLNEV